MSENEVLLNNQQITEILYKSTPCKGCIYLFFRIGAYMLILIGLGDFLGSILVYTSTRTIDWYNGGYGFLGMVMSAKVQCSPYYY